VIKKRALSASRDPSFPGTVFALRGTEPEAGNIVFHAGTDLDSGEMLKITQTGFYVRGVKVEQDDREAQLVYNAFKEWMVYSALTRKY
jgi:hypothetical protein